MKKFGTIFISWLVILPFVLSLSCTRMMQDETVKELVPVKSIGVLPAQPASITVQPSDTKTMKQLEAGAQIINTLLLDYFRDHKNVRLISQTELESLQGVQAGNHLFVAREAGRQLGYDAVLVTEVMRYQARTGSAYAVDSPASVAFSLKLLTAANSQVIWSADFDQTQQPLFDNILQSRTTGSGFRWLTAAELTQAGLTKKLDRCSYLQKD
ncbi:MAG: hypothetical protein JRD19_06025 [Deltaproteobacteria bacterium]|nr:hypothetical protein [Deltaproteobacteria bacterium]